MAVGMSGQVDNSTPTGERRIWVWSFAGLARDGVDSVTPLPIATARATGMLATSVFEDAYACLIPKRGQRFQMSLDGDGVFPVSGQSRDAAARVTITLDDERFPEIARYFLAASGARTPATRALAGTTFGTQSTTISLESGGGSQFSADDVIYWRRQAFRVASSTANAVTVVNSIPDPANPGSFVTRSGTTTATQPEDQFGCFRKELLGRASNETQFEDDRIYTVNPFLRGREVLLYTTDGEATETVWGRFTIQGDPVVDSDSCTVQVRLRGILGMLQDRKINYRPNVYQAQQGVGTVVVNGQRVSAPSFTLTGTGKSAAEIARDSLWEGAGAGVVQVDKGIACGPGMGTLSTTDVRNITGQAVQPWLSEAFDDEADKAVKANELLCSDPLDETSPTGVTLTDATKHPLYSTELPLPPDVGGFGRIANHPFEIALCLIGAIDSNLPEHWRGQVPPSWVDVDGILSAAVTRYDFASPWNGALWGKDGKSLKLSNVLDGLLRGIFCTMGLTDDGKLTFVGMLDVVSAGTLDRSRTLPGRGSTIDQSNTVDEFTVRTGISFSKNDIAHILTADDGYDSDLFPYQDSSIAIDAPGLIHPDEVVGEGFSQLPGVNGMLGVMTSMAQLFRSSNPVMRVDVTGATRIRSGRYYEFSAPGLRDGTTGLTNHDSDEEYFGYVMAAEQDIGDAEKALSQSLTVLRLPYELAAIGPAGEVASSATPGGNTTLTLTQALYVLEISYEVGGETLNRDVEQFAAAQVCIITDLNGVPKTDPFTIASTTNASNLIAVTGSIAAIGGGTYTHASGDIVTLADADDSLAADLEEFAWVNSGDAWGI